MEPITPPNRAAARRQAAQQRANQRRQEKARDAAKLRISQGVDLLRNVVAAGLDTPAEHLGLIIEAGQVRGYDTRQVSLLAPAQEEAPMAVDGEGVV